MDGRERSLRGLGKKTDLRSAQESQLSLRKPQKVNDWACLVMPEQLTIDLEMRRQETQNGFQQERFSAAAFTDDDERFTRR